MKRTLFALLAFFVVGSALAQSPAKIRITTWNLEWFPNGSPHDSTPEKQAQRIEAANSVVELYGFFGANEATIFSKRGSPRSGSQTGNSFKAP